MGVFLKKADVQSEPGPLGGLCRVGGGLATVLGVVAVFAAMVLLVNNQIKLRMNEVLVRHGEDDPKFSRIDRIYQDVKGQAELLAVEMADLDPSAPETREWLRQKLVETRETHKEVVAAVFACEDRDLMLLVQWRDGQPVFFDGSGYRRRGWYRDTIAAGHGAWHEPFLGDFIRDPIAVYAVPFGKDPDGRPMGVFCLDISLAFMGNIFVSRFQMFFIVSGILGFALMLAIAFPYVRKMSGERMRLVAEHRQAEKDMSMAKLIQANALPSTFPPYPALTGVIDIHALMRPAREVGGDFYDFYFAAPNKLALVIADVSGKGIPAALFMMRAKATLQSYLKAGIEIVEAVEKTNHRLARLNEANMFVTAWVGIVDLAGGELEYVNAGHNPPLLKRTDGSVAFLTERGGLPLATMDGMPYRKQTLSIKPGDGLVLYTDGVTEAMDGSQTLYGNDRLFQVVRGLFGTHDACGIANGVLKDVDAFACGTEQADDITILAFKLVGKSGH